MKFSENIYFLRKENGLSANELAKKLGFMENTIYAWEKERAQPNIETLNKLADIFNVSVDYLLGRTDELGIVQNDNANKLNSDDAKLLKYFHGIDEVQQRAILRTAESFYLEAQQNTKSIS